VERNPVRAGMRKTARDWLWSSVGQAALPAELQVKLADWPIHRRRDWVQWVDLPQTAAEERTLRTCMKESRPYGDDKWLTHVQTRFGWREPMPRGRPEKKQP
jgi:hypothetical protein